MTSLNEVINHPLVVALGWTLLHSIWQGALIAAGYALAKRATRHESAQVKYTLASSALLLMVILPAVTFGVQSSGWFTGATSSGKIPIQEELFDTTELDLAL